MSYINAERSLELVYGCDEALIAHANRVLGVEIELAGAAIGVARGNQIIAAVIYSDWRAATETVEMSIISGSPRWCTKGVLRAVFSYAFENLGANRAEAFVAHPNDHVEGFLMRLGFEFEGIARQAYPGRRDAACYSMLKHECKWI